MKIPFIKMQGLGNDYIYVDVTAGGVRGPQREALLADPARWSRKWSDRRTGIGSDGLVLIGDSTVADFSMRIFNADGSEAQMCGNASRCIGKYVYEKGLCRRTTVTLETLSGVKVLDLHTGADGLVESVSVDMGVARAVSQNLAVEACGQAFTGIAVDVGNPHLVLFVEDAGAADVEHVGPVLERHPLFPDRVNVEFLSRLPAAGNAGAPTRLRMRVWERGSGITRACGTGACASCVAATLEGWSGDGRCEIEMDGGSLVISYDRRSGRVLMRGPAEYEYEGTVALDEA